MKRNLSVDLTIIPENNDSNLPMIGNDKQRMNSRNFGSNTQQRQETKKERAREIVYQSPYGRKLPGTAREDFIG